MDSTLAQILSKLFETTAALNAAQQRITELEALLAQSEEAR